jgi:tetratricopeptide (TPR) repeat protein
MRRSRAAALAVGIAAAALAYDPRAPAASAKSVALALVAAVALASSFARPESPGRRCVPIGAAGLALVAGWYTVTMAWAPAPSVPISWLSAAALALALGARPLEERSAIAELAAVLISAGSCVIAIVEAVTGAAWLHGGHGNPNWLGLTLAAALPLVLGRLARAWNGTERWPLVACATASLIAIALSASHTAWVALALSALWFAPGRARWFAALPVVGLVIAHRALASAIDGRLWIWRASARAALAGLPVGHGSFSFAYLDAQAPMLRELSYDQAAQHFVNATDAHHGALQLLVLGGPIALALGALTFATAFLSRTRFPAAAASILVVAVASFGDAPLEQPAVVALCACALALTPAAPARKSDRALGIVTLAAVACALPLSLQSWLGARLVSRAREDIAFEERIALLERACTIDPRSGDAALEAGLGWLEHGDAERALGFLDRSRALMANVGTDVAIGNAELMRGHKEAAIAAYQRALGLHPGLFRAHANLAEALREAGDLDAASRHLEAALELQPHHPKLERIAEQLRRDRIEAATR